MCFDCRAVWLSHMRMGTAWRKSQTNLASHYRSCGMSYRRGMNSRPRCLCYRRNWHITRGRLPKLELKKIIEIIDNWKWCWWTFAISPSEELEDDISSVICAPSPPPCPSSTDRPESGIRRLWVSNLTVAPRHYAVLFKTAQHVAHPHIYNLTQGSSAQREFHSEAFIVNEAVVKCNLSDRVVRGNRSGVTLCPPA